MNTNLPFPTRVSLDEMPDSVTPELDAIVNDGLALWTDQHNHRGHTNDHADQPHDGSYLDTTMIPAAAITFGDYVFSAGNLVHVHRVSRGADYVRLQGVLFDEPGCQLVDVAYANDFDVEIVIDKGFLSRPTTRLSPENRALAASAAEADEVALAVLPRPETLLHVEELVEPCLAASDGCEMPALWHMTINDHDAPSAYCSLHLSAVSAYWLTDVAMDRIVIERIL